MLGLRIPFTADGTEFKKGLDGMRKNTDSFSDSIKGKLASAFGGAAVFFAMKKLINLASDLQESVSKNKEIFGSNAKAVEDWAGTLDKAFGQSKAKALEAVTGFGSMFNVLGVGSEESIKMSKSLVELASDMASFDNTSVEDAILAIGSGLRGEAEPLRRYSVFLNDATMRQKALSMGIYDGEGTLTNYQKAMASYGIIMEQTAQAQGDFGRTIDGVANSQRVATAIAENQAASIGKSLLPAYQSLLKVLKSDEAVQGAQAVGSIVEYVIAGIRILWVTLGAIIGAVYYSAAMNLKEISAAIGDVVKAVDSLVRLDFDGVKSAVGSVGERIKAMWNNVEEGAKGAGEEIDELINKMAEEMQEPEVKDTSSAEKEAEALKKRMTLLEEIAKLEADAKARDLTVTEKLLELEKQRAKLAEGMGSDDEGTRLTAKREMLKIDKEIEALQDKKDTEEVTASKKSEALRKSLQEMKDENAFDAMSDPEKMASLTEKRDSAKSDADKKFWSGDIEGSMESEIEAQKADDELNKLKKAQAEKEADLKAQYQEQQESRAFEKMDKGQKTSFLTKKRDGALAEADKAEKEGDVTKSLEMKIKAGDFQSEIDGLASQKKEEPTIAVSSLAEVGGGGGVSATMIDPMLREAQRQSMLVQEQNSILREILAVSGAKSGKSEPVL